MSNNKLRFDTELLFHPHMGVHRLHGPAAWAIVAFASLLAFSVVFAMGIENKLAREVERQSALVAAAVTTKPAVNSVILIGDGNGTVPAGRLFGVVMSKKNPGLFMANTDVTNSPVVSTSGSYAVGGTPFTIFVAYISHYIGQHDQINGAGFKSEDGTSLWITPSVGGIATIDTTRPPTYDLTKTYTEKFEAYVSVKGLEIPAQIELLPIFPGIVSGNAPATLKNGVSYANKGGVPLGTTNVIITAPILSGISAAATVKTAANAWNEYLSFPAIATNGTYKILLKQTPSFPNNQFSIQSVTFVPQTGNVPTTNIVSFSARYRRSTGEYLENRVTVSGAFTPGSAFPNNDSFSAPQKVSSGESIRVLAGQAFYSSMPVTFSGVPFPAHKDRTIRRTIIFPPAPSSGTWRFTIMPLEYGHEEKGYKIKAMEFIPANTTTSATPANIISVPTADEPTLNAID